MSPVEHNQVLENDPSIRYGKLLAHPSPGEEIVISGISGKFPLSRDIDEYKHNLYNKIDMITHRPQAVHPEMPLAAGKFKDGDISKFDTGYFGIQKVQTSVMSEMCRLLLERCVECIFDAGLHPEDLEGTKTGVFLGTCFSDTQEHWFLKEFVKNGNAICGNMYAMIANRISYFLKLNGPSFNSDTACSSTLFALDAAYKSIRNGLVDEALVCGSNIMTAAGVTLQFARLGVLSKEGIIRPFDDNASGYVRSEAISAILLQKAKHSKRIYAKIIHMKTNCDGFKEQGITYPNGEAQMNLLKEIYLESGVNPHDISYIEAHGTGTVVGDPEELNSIDEFFAQGRNKPLLIGTVKSSIGHSEPVSGLCSIVKAILAFETNIISPNLNFQTPRKDIDGLLQGRMKVVVDNTQFQNQNGLLGISSFGFGGGNAHVILQWNSKEKINNGKPDDVLPRIICVSGRSQEAVLCLITDVVKQFDAEHIGLIHNSFRKAVKNHLFRGYAIVSNEGILNQSVKGFNPNGNFYIYFGEITLTSGKLVQELQKLPLLYNFQNRIQKILNKKQLHLQTIWSNISISPLHRLLGGIITQLFIAELLIQMEVELQVFGCKSGVLAAAYFSNSLSLEEVLESVFVIGELLNENGNGTKISYDKTGTLYKFKDTILMKFKKNVKHCKQYKYNGREVRTSPEFFTQALFQEIDECYTVRKNGVILKIGDGLFTEISSRRTTFINFNVDGGFQELLMVLGRLYESGLQPQVQKLYPQVEFPVSRGTPMISSKIKWKHDFDYFVPSFDIAQNKVDSETMLFGITVTEEDWADLSGHVIDGRNLFPATGYLYLVWFLMSELVSIDLNLLKVVFENCKFKRACTLPNKSSTYLLNLRVMIQRVGGNFEVSEGDVTVVTGKITIDDDPPAFNSHSETEIPDLRNTSDVLNNKDIYKELRLRGYNYSGLFKKLSYCNKAATNGVIGWEDNWIAFMDNMLQLKILSEDTRLLYVPISIARLTIDPTVHLDTVNSLKSDNQIKSVDIPVQHCMTSGIIRSGGIEIKGLIASSIPRRKTKAFPVLERYQFVPNEAKLTVEESVRIFMQIALENNCGFKVNVAELLDGASKSDELLGLLVQNVLEDQPLVQCNVTVHTTKNIDLNVNINNDDLKSGSDYTLVIGSELFTRQNVLDKAIKATVENGYVLSRESVSTNVNMLNLSQLTILNICETDKEKLVFLKKHAKNDIPTLEVCLEITNKSRTFDWLDNLKEAVAKNSNVIAWCQNEPLNGIIGLINCIRREPKCQNVRCVFILDEAPDFDINHPFYQEQLRKNMAVNVYFKGQWGTYRHLLLEELQVVENDHCYANNTIRGDLSSFKWIEGPLSRDMSVEKYESLVDVYYSSLNFKDVMNASGKISMDISTRDRKLLECGLGFEFSGKTKSGKRVMGIVGQSALSSLVKADNHILWDVPNSWSLKEAATVPAVYATCLQALVVVGKIKPSDSILIHSGTGGIGQAAINLCLGMGCTVFTTVGTEEKRKFIKENFPKINESHIGNSRDLNFEKMIKKETKGRGVDIVLNSLAEEKLFASLRCLAPNGRFLEIGKFDLASDNQINLEYLEKGISYHGVMLDAMFTECAEVKEKLHLLLQNNIDSGAVKPLKATVYNKDEVETAFRYMASGKHIGKVLMEIRKEDENIINDNIRFQGIPRYYCNPEKSYVICGGLGGFGLELADWLILRGAMNVVLTSRKGVVTGYQRYRISIWEKYGCNIKICTQNITSKSGCIELINEANRLAPVEAIFNLAVVLQDAILGNQTEDSFNISFGPKAYATEYLDQVSRTLCPKLRDFVVFSSVSCGRGNAGQSNYGMANSVMERICEKRRIDGYPALAIQWGAIGDVGLVAELQENHIELEIGGTLQQSISSCLQVMDVLLKQREAPVVSSMIVAEKRGSFLSGNIEDVIVAILGIKDIKSISKHATLAELGMDSITAVEIKQTLESEFNIFLTPSEMRSITLGKIRELQENLLGEERSEDQSNQSSFDLFNIINDMNVQKISSLFCKLKTKHSDRSTLPKIIAIPGVEGHCDVLESLTENLEVDAYGINYCIFGKDNNFSVMADMLLPYIEEIIKPQKSFNIIAHSLGSLIGLEIVSKLERLGYKGEVTLLDGSPASIKNTSIAIVKTDGDLIQSTIENSLIALSLMQKLTIIELDNAMAEVSKCLTLKEKLPIAATKLNLGVTTFEDIIVKAAEEVVKRVGASIEYNPAFDKLQSKVRLFKPTIMSVCTNSEDLSQYCEQPVEVRAFQGTHTSFVANKEMAQAIMDYLLGPSTVPEE